MRVLVLDNYDSFTYNLVQDIGRLGHEPVVFRNDALEVSEVPDLGVDRIVISPGPGRPEEAGISIKLIRELGGKIPILGVCLGHQALGVSFGARVVGAPELKHGKTSWVQHEGESILRDLPRPFQATRYHSLIVDEAGLPDTLKIIARTDDRLIMAMRHRELPLFGVQFHPESIMTPQGIDILRNFLCCDN